MKTQIHSSAQGDIAEIVSDEIIIVNTEDVLNLLVNFYYQGIDRVIVYEKNVIPDFFNLKTGLAGELLQKFSNYRIRLAIIGDFSLHTSKSLRDFIFESNKIGLINFVESLDRAIQQLSRD